MGTIVSKFAAAPRLGSFVSLMLPIVVMACSGAPSSGNGATQGSDGKREALCEKVCSGQGIGAADICETKLSPYSDAALDAYDVCKGESVCIHDELVKKEPGPDAVAFGKWACATCGIAETDDFCTTTARAVSPYSADALGENRSTCATNLRDAATNATGQAEWARTASCAAKLGQCFKVQLYGGNVCKAQ